MALHNLHLEGKPIDVAEEAIVAEFAKELRVGDRIPAQSNFKGNCQEVLGIRMATYSKIIRRLAQRGLVTKVGHGVGYVYGKPSASRINQLIEERRLTGKRLNHLEKCCRSDDIKYKAASTRVLRNEIRTRIAEAIAKENIAAHVVQALKDHDVAHMMCCEKALKLVGADFSQSEEALEQMKKVGVQPQTFTAINFSFELARPGAPQAIQAEVVDDGST